MRARVAWTIFRKELTETLRDRRTLFMMVGLPILLYPMMIIAISWFQESQVETREERTSIVAIWGDLPPGLSSGLQAAERVTTRPWEAVSDEVRAGLLEGSVAMPRARPAPKGRTGTSATAEAEEENPVLAAARAAIVSSRVDAVVVAWPGSRQALDSGGLGTVSVYFDSVRPNSVKAFDRVNEALIRYRRALASERERDWRLKPGFTRGLDVLARNVASETRRTAELLGMILPFTLVALSLLGGFYPAIDVTAGEKERGTMQTLLCAPLRPAEIIAGKFLTVWAMALIAALVNVASLAATLARIVPGQQLSVATSAYLLTFVMLVPVTFIIAAAFLAVAAFARDFRDGQNFLTPVYMVLAMPAAITALPGVRLTSATSFVPVLNIALLIKSLLMGEAQADQVFLVLMASALYAMLAMLLAARVFQQEQVLLGGQQSLVQLFGLERRGGGVPSMSMVLVSYAAVLVTVFYGSLLLGNATILRTLLVTEYGFFLAPTLLFVLLMGFSARETLALRLPPWRGVVAAVLIGVSGWTVAGGILIRLMPPPESLVKALEKILLLDGRAAPLWVVWLVVGVTPAICEELFFRGWVLSGLGRIGRAPALIVTAVLFGLAHASIYRALPTAFLGIVFGYLVWKTRSIASSMIAHALNNALMATLVLSPSVGQRLGLGSSAYLPWRVTAIGTAVLIAGLAMLWRLPPAAPPAEPYKPNGPAAR